MFFFVITVPFDVSGKNYLRIRDISGKFIRPIARIGRYARAVTVLIYIALIRNATLVQVGIYKEETGAETITEIEVIFHFVLQYDDEFEIVVAFKETDFIERNFVDVSGVRRIIHAVFHIFSLRRISLDVCIAVKYSDTILQRFKRIGFKSYDAVCVGGIFKRRPCGISRSRFAVFIVEFTCVRIIVKTVIAPVAAACKVDTENFIVISQIPVFVGNEF